MSLPTGEEWGVLVGIYPSMNDFNMQCYADVYGYKNVHSFRRAMQKRGVYRVDSPKSHRGNDSDLFKFRMHDVAPLGKTLTEEHSSSRHYSNKPFLTDNMEVITEGYTPQRHTVKVGENKICDEPNPYGRIPVVEVPIVEHVPYPEIKLIPFQMAKVNRDPEDMGIVISDWHLCKVTPDYNIDIAKARVDYLTQSIMKIISLHQPIRKLWVFDAGDTIQGENPFQGSKIGEASHSAEEQIHDYAIPILSRMMLSLNQGVPDIEYFTVRSNHGKYGKEANPKTNWQTMMCRSLKASLVNQGHITVNVPDKFYQLVNIKGFRFFMVHGHQVNASQGIPLFALRRKMQEWYALVGGFHYGYGGHFHTKAADSVNSVADYTLAPPLVTGDEWALEIIGRASIPKQLCFGIHSKYGRSFSYELQTDDKYLPKPFNEPEGIVK